MWQGQQEHESVHLIRTNCSISLYRDPAAAEKMNPFAEQEAWEDHQISMLLC